ncbi:growth-regulating factor 1-like [Lolium perenne]|uniref:growth-regulating factor 1-like n=1 Tax=Lolium perenne TaxID=4522 RepID=UPI0021F58DE8|nr:growth-regulating factor 1-like [Lolium perenne]
MMMLGGRAGGGVGTVGGVGGGRCPFTASQWQELEHQALIYKYMASGVPIPSDLLLPLRRSFLLDSALATSPSLGYPPQAALGWGCFGMGFGRKAEDPEPGRCRRTDGKKWRCSKEAYPDSKYCEKHMHRGKNRSRKPVEMSLATPPPPSSSASSSSSNINSAVNVATTSPAPSYHRAVTHDASPYHALYGGPYASAGRPQQQHAGAYHHHHHAQASPFHLHLDTTHPHPPPSYYATMDHSKDTYAYGHSVKEVHGGEHAFFSSDVSSDRDVHQHHTSAGQWQFKQLGGMEQPKQQQQHNQASLYPGYGNNGSAYAIDLAAKEEEEEKERRQHCFLLGTDLRLDKPSSDDGGAAQKPLRPFFDEWPHEKAGSKGSWMGLEGETQLSISIPMSAHNELPITTTSRYHHGE